MEHIQFSLKTIRVNNFEILVKRPLIEETINLEWVINYSYADNFDILCQFVCFYNTSDEPWLSFAFDAFFELHKHTWDFFAKDNASIVLPKNFAAHLAAITVSSARGALIVLTQNTAYFDQSLPLLNLTELFEEDVLIQLKGS